MGVGGLSALLLQSLHPEAMAAVSAHPGSGATPPRGRLQCTSTVLATTMHSTADSVWSACERVRAGHARIHGVTDEGVPYRSPTRWNGYIWRRPRASSGPTSGLEQDRWPRGVAVMVR